MKAALVGCGVIGQRRVEYFPKDLELVAAFDPVTAKAESLKKYSPSLKVCQSLEELLALPGLDCIFVAGINSALAPTCAAALNKGLHVLVEKPGARCAAELSKVPNPHGKIFKVGFNHRFHPAFFDILDELKKNPSDPIMYMRASYGNGARLGFDKEWRANVELSGGGELLDQGVHVLDLAACLLPNLKVLTGLSRTHYWQMPVDDNTWGYLSTEQGQTFSFHVSSSEWKNEFRFEVYTRARKYQWIGLGRSYGPETLTIYKMKPEMGPPDIEKREYSNDDNSWSLENKNFVEAIQGKAKAWGIFEDAVKVMTWVDELYESSKELQKNSKLAFPHPKYFGDAGQ